MGEILLVLDHFELVFVRVEQDLLQGADVPPPKIIHRWFYDYQRWVLALALYEFLYLAIIMRSQIVHLSVDVAENTVVVLYLVAYCTGDFWLRGCGRWLLVSLFCILFA